MLVVYLICNSFIYKAYAESMLTDKMFNSADSSVNFFLEDFQYYQITIFVNSSDVVNSNGLQKYIEKLTQFNPCICVDLKKIKLNQDDRFLKQLLLENSTQSTLNLILYRNFNSDLSTHLQNLKHFLNTVIRIAQKPMRPKCLIIFFRYNIINLEKLIKNLLKYGWMKKFLDLSILEVNSNLYSDKSDKFLHSYNPFFKLFTKKKFSIGTQVFEDKLNNVNRYSLKIPVYNFSPYIEFKKGKEGRVIHVDGIQYHLIKSIVEIMNFAPKYTLQMENVSIFTEICQVLYDELLNENINIVPIIAASCNDFENIFPWIYINSYKETLMVTVPIIINKKLIFNVVNFIFILLIILLIIFSIYLINMFNFHKEKMGVIVTLKILFSIPVSTLPKKVTNRIFLTFIMFTSSIYLSAFYSQIVNSKLIYEEIPFNTLKEISESNLIPYIRIQTFQEIFNSSIVVNDPYINAIILKSERLANMETCFKTLYRNQNVFCISFRRRAEAYINKYSKISNKRSMKIANPVIFDKPKNFILERGSPYIKKMNYILRKIEESGIRIFKDSIREYDTRREYHTQENIQNIIPLHIIFFWLIANLIPAVIFLLELTCKH